MTRRPRCLAAEPPSSAYIEVTITLSPAVADLVSALLFESGATAVVVSEVPHLTLRTHLPDDATLEAKLTRVRTYLVALRSVGLDPGPARVVARPFLDRGWAMRWREFFRPVRIGRRLVIAPSWNACAEKQGDIVVTLDPGMAFGTGQHATTRMCLELLEAAFGRFRVHRSEFRDRSPELSSQNLKTMNHELRTMNRGPAVLDLGTGSGLLAIAAFRLGAATVLALDTDGVACRIASENIRQNGGDGRIVVKQGSLDAAGRRTFDLILANLTAGQLIGLAPRLVKSLRAGGRLIASGILASQEDRVAATFRRCGMVPERARKGRGWVGLMCRRLAVSARGAG
ncbi:MAG: 50S ribosomal protein L11 methyltransferase [Candidatus Methylomirabilis oxyfera]|nr:50S ribosomal protein L11 methyltransferase [Candidatus Methylomirabilis oxyfera]